MLKTIQAGFISLVVVTGPVLAQSQGTCTTQDLASAVDRYAAEPFGARSWRVLQGLGDPMIDPAPADADTWVLQDRWKSLTATIMPDAPGLSDISWNCRIGYPLSVLEKRVGSLGKDHPYVRQWFQAQEQVLKACSSEEGGAALPPPLDVDPAYINLQRMDRAYQEASIAFYRDPARGLVLFRAIAESTSPHRAAARYNIANLLAHAKQPDAARQEAEAILADPTLSSVHGITRELLGFIANQEDTATGWAQLIDSDIATLSKPAAEILANRDLARQYATALYDIDFVGVRTKEGTWWLDGALPENATISKALVDASRRYPMALWMIAGQSANQKYQLAPWSLIGSGWQARMDDYISRALALEPAGRLIAGPAREMMLALAARPDQASRSALWSEAVSAMGTTEESCGESPETAAAGLLLSQAVRVSVMAGDIDEAIAALQTVPFKTARAYSMGAVFPFIQYLAGQGDVAGARKVRDALVTPEFLDGFGGDSASIDRDRFSALLGLIAEDEGKWKAAVRLSSDPASDILFNFLPVKTLWELAADQSFDSRQRALFSRAAWTRDYALVRKVDGTKLESYLDLNPDIKALAEDVKSDYPGISPRNQRLLTILRAPPHNILVAMPGPWMSESIKPENFTEVDGWNPNDRNWWCPFEPDRQLAALRQQADFALGSPYGKAYVQRRLGEYYDPALEIQSAEKRDLLLTHHPMVKAVDWKEIRALSRMPQAPQRLSEAALSWARKSDGKDGAPEALALAVRTTRYGCNWHGSHEAYSRPAQQLLASRFYGTPWQQQTPYWFGCRRTEWNKDFTEKVTVCTPKTWPKQEPLK